ncbi:MAG: hypothetical protein KAS17_06580 [Victivallaceae bacterium]|nr:hypothetical protein [Victivallaceae bacterium]
MTIAKLTLSAERDIIDIAKKMASAENTSISAMFSGFIKAKSRTGKIKLSALAPNTRNAIKLGQELGKSLPVDFDYKKELANAISEKHGV